MKLTDLDMGLATKRVGYWKRLQDWFSFEPQPAGSPSRAEVATSVFPVVDIRSISRKDEIYKKTINVTGTGYQQYMMCPDAPLLMPGGITTDMMPIRRCFLKRLRLSVVTGTFTLGVVIIRFMGNHRKPDTLSLLGGGTEILMGYDQSTTHYPAPNIEMLIGDYIWPFVTAFTSEGTIEMEALVTEEDLT